MALSSNVIGDIGEMEVSKRFVITKPLDGWMKWFSDAVGTLKPKGVLY